MTKRSPASDAHTTSQKRWKKYRLEVPTDPVELRQYLDRLWAQDFVRREEAALMLNISPASIKRLESDGQLTKHEINPTAKYPFVRIRVDELRAKYGGPAKAA